MNPRIKYICAKMQTALLAVCILLFCSVSAFAQKPATGEIPIVLAPRHESVLAAEIGSRVIKIYKEFGQSFRKGNTLIRLDNGPAELDVRKAQAQLDRASKEFEITQDLFKTKSVSILELEEARSKQTVATVDLVIAKQKLSRCTVHAPFSGRVSKLEIHTHEWVEVGQPLIDIVDDSVLLAKFLLPSSMYENVKIDSAAHVSIQETGKSYTGRISHIGAEIDPSSRSFEVYAEIKNTSGELRGGMRGAIRIIPEN
ncbi:efflux RND transporter periplasmic adaptor subunit [Desulfovibrio sp. JC022]|uniref:efflux RND transporter periplasmic adaptor subunit n=1 Tax=Desulfovibrio sp. JC022 TaxID=2593642 RepID=UPI0013D62481|nr:efflux RND transporter periplasmic adaptor subunit [Desulfovibrio sp. JC022]NDV24538.1 efflux RND transporter periplasmic adaptor subunit [Desulfovibrio sp. JC022]